MDSWSQWSSLLTPHPNPYRFSGKKPKRFYRSSVPASVCSTLSTMSSFSTSKRRKRKLKKLRRNSSPPPKIQSFCFESSPILDIASPNDFGGPWHSITEEVNVVNLSNGYPKVGDPVFCTRDRCNAYPHAITSNQLNTDYTSVPGLNTSLDRTTYIESFRLDSMPTATSAQPAYAFPFSPSVVPRKLKKRRNTALSLIANPSGLSSNLELLYGLIPTALPPDSKVSSSSCRTQPTSPVSPHLVVDKVSIPFLGADRTQVTPLQHAPQGTFGRCNSQSRSIMTFPSASNFPPVTTFFVAAQHSEITTNSPGVPGDVWQDEPSQEARIRLDDTVHGEPKLETGSADLTEDPESEGIWALRGVRGRASPFKHCHPVGLSGSSTSSPLTTEGSAWNAAMESINWLYKRRNVIATGDNIATDATIGNDQEGGMSLGLQSSMSIQEMDGDNIHSVVPLSSPNPLSQSEISSRGTRAATVHLPIIESSTLVETVVAGCGENTTSSCRTKSKRISRCRGHTSPALTTETEQVGVKRGPGRGRSASVLISSSLKSALAKWRWKKRRGMSDSEADNLVRQSSDSAPECATVVLSGASLDGLTDTAVPETASPEPLDPTPADIQEMETAGKAAPSDQVEEIAANGCSDSSLDGMNAVPLERVNDYEKLVHPKTKAKFTIGDMDDRAVIFPVRGENLSKDEGLAALERHTSLRVVSRDIPISEPSPSGNSNWTLANALKDEGISDTRLVCELEKMREGFAWQREEEREWDVEKVVLEGWGDANANPECGKGQEKNTEEIDIQSDPNRPNVSVKSPPSRSFSIPSQSWLTAKRALLTCREFVLTERHYLGLLSALVNQETATPPPPLMLHHAAELLQTNQSFLKAMENEPTTMGVANAFLDREEEIEGAYVKWCELVGDWFSGDGVDGNNSGGRASIDGSENWGRRLSLKKRSRAGSKTDGDTNGNTSPSLDTEGDEGPASPLKRTVSTWRKSMPTLGFDAVSIYGGGVWKKDKEKEDEKLEDIIAPVKKPTVRELAILPTQRVMRYSLLYQDLLSFTPSTSASRTLVEQATRAATRIAQNCDRAQGNAAFNWSSASSRHNTNSRSSSRRGSRRPSFAMTAIPPVPPLNEVIGKQGATPVDSDTVSPSASPTKATFAPQPLANKGNGNPSSSSRRLSVSFMSLGLAKGTQPPMAFTPTPESVQVVANDPFSSEV